MERLHVAKTASVLSGLTAKEIQGRIDIAEQSRDQVQRYIDELHQELLRRAGIPGH